MTMMTLVCPKCGAVAKLSLAEPNYVGPRRCWKCHEFFTITIHNNQVVSCEPLSEEEYERQQEAKKTAEKMGGGIGFAKREEPSFPQKAAEKPRSTIDSPKQEEFSFFQKAANTSKGGIDFVKRDEPAAAQKPPEKPQNGIDSSKLEAPDFFQKAAETSKGGIDFVKRDEPAIAQKPPEKPQGSLEAPKPSEPAKPPKPMDLLWANLKSSGSKPASKPIEPPSRSDNKTSNIFPPERYNTFVPLEDTKDKPGKSQKPNPPQEKRQDYTKPLRQADKDRPAIFPPDRFQTFVPLEDDDKSEK
jgi:hypothetical protein